MPDSFTLALFAAGTLLAAIGLAKLHGDALACKISNPRREFARRRSTPPVVWRAPARPMPD